MRAKISGRVESIQEAKSQKSGKAYLKVQLSQKDSRSGIMSLALVRCWSGAKPKVGEQFEAEVVIQAFASKSGTALLSADAF